MSSHKQRAATKVARAAQTNDPDRIAEARRELALANIEAAIEHNLANSPPLSAAQKKRIAALLRTGGTAFEMTPVSELGKVRPTKADLAAARRRRAKNPKEQLPGRSNRPGDYEPESDR